MCLAGKDDFNRSTTKNFAQPFAEGYLRRSSNDRSNNLQETRVVQKKMFDDVISKRRLLGAKRFGIEPRAEELSISSDELYDLYKSMEIDPFDNNVRFHSVLLYGIDGLTAFQIHKIFAEFSPTAVDIIDDKTCNVIWDERYTVGKMMLEMTKPLKRVRGHRKIEEGEVHENSSDEEDGEMKEEQGDDVVISIKGKTEGTSKFHCTNDDYVEVDVDKVKIPPGKWRVLTKHVSHNQFIILRLSLREDLRKVKVGLSHTSKAVETNESATDKGYTYMWTNKKDHIRPGLNIFDAKGNELEWDYEHDTRFYTEPEAESKEAKDDKQKESSKITEAILGKRKIKSHGRGAKKARDLSDLLSGDGSMVADREENNKTTNKPHSTQVDESYDDTGDSDISDDLDPEPTPQPWNCQRVQPRFTTSSGNTVKRN
uniref:Nuclear cap-binding protein subunit 3 n=1 Tax=Syphacia muris TaxID=451379 RepID=A0A0N5AQA9_9BILA